jgi:hypothetical protein
MIAQFHVGADCEIRFASLIFRTICHGSITATALPAPPDPRQQSGHSKETTA